MFDRRAPLVEHAHRTVTSLPATTKLSGENAEELLTENSRGNKTAIELFLAGIASWDTGLRRRMDYGSHSQE